MNTCGTCKHFGKAHRDEFRIPTGYHVCRLIDHLAARRTCDPVAATIDGSDFFSALCVKEEFGCNQWEAHGPT